MMIDRPLFLILLIPVLIIFCFRLSGLRKHSLAYPLTSYLKKKKMPKPKWSRHLPIYLRMLTICLLVLALCGSYQGYQQVKKVRQTREISLVLDYSGSMSGEPLKASIQVTRQLIKKRSDDIFNITLFADKAKTAIGISGELSDFVTIESIKEVEEKMGEKLGSSTGIGLGLFNAFYSITLRNKLFSREELIIVRSLLVDGQQKKVLEFIDSKANEPLKNQALILISDFQFPGSPLIDQITMLQMIKKIGVRIFMVGIGIGSYNTKYQEIYVPFAEESEGKSYRIKTSYDYSHYNPDNQADILKDLEGIFEEIDRVAKAPTMEKVEFQKVYLTFHLTMAALVLFVLSIFTTGFKRFKEAP